MLELEDIPEDLSLTAEMLLLSELGEESHPGSVEAQLEKSVAVIQSVYLRSIGSLHSVLASQWRRGSDPRQIEHVVR